MSNWMWALAVVAFFVVLTFTVFKRAKKDMLGAIAIAVGIILVGAIFIGVTGCAVRPEYQPWLEAGLAYDRSHTVGSDPACVVRLRQPIWPGHIVAGFEHHSSCGDQDDRAEINQVELMAIIPLGRRK